MGTRVAVKKLLNPVSFSHAMTMLGQLRERLGGAYKL
jgi:hypothetical protein